MKSALLNAWAWVRAKPASALAVVALAVFSVGCAMERPSLGLIVPGGFVLACLCFTHLRGSPPDA